MALRRITQRFVSGEGRSAMVKGDTSGALAKMAARRSSLIMRQILRQSVRIYG
jgi:hypothetical protein